MISMSSLNAGLIGEKPMLYKLYSNISCWFVFTIRFDLIFNIVPSEGLDCQILPIQTDFCYIMISYKQKVVVGTSEPCDTP